MAQAHGRRIREWAGCVFIGISLNGFIARTDGDLAWLTDPPVRAHQASGTDYPAQVWETFYPSVDAIVMGRETYDTVMGFDSWPFEHKDVIVLSSTMAETDRVHVARSLAEVDELLHELGTHRAYIDGGRTIQSFLAAGWVDEITVSIVPILIGCGRRLFGDLDHDVELTLQGHHSTPDDGLVRITYAVTSSAQAAAERPAKPAAPSSRR